MKFYLSLNLKEFNEAAPNLDIYNAVVLDFLRDMCISQDPRIVSKRITDEKGNLWTWVDYSYILEQLPYLKRINSKSSISKIINNLRENKFIETNHLASYKTYIKISHKVDKLIFSSFSLEKSQSFPTEKLEHESFSRETNHIDIDRLDSNKESNTYISDSTINDHITKKQKEDDIQRIFEEYTKKILPGSRLTSKSKDKIKTRLKEFSVKDILTGIDNFSKDDWWMTNNAHRGIAWFFHSEDRTEQFKNLIPRNKKPEKEKLRLSKYQT